MKAAGLGSLTLSFQQNPIGHTSHPYSMWEGTAQGHEYQGVGITGEHLEAGYYHHQSYKMVNIKESSDPP